MPDNLNYFMKMMTPAIRFCSLILLFALVRVAVAKSDAPLISFDKKPLVIQKIVDVADDDDRTAAKIAPIVAEVVSASFPELKSAKIEIKTFRSRSDYFRSRFSFLRVLTFRRFHYFIFVNPNIFEKNAPPEGVQAIIAHELAHVAYYRRQNSLSILGLTALLSDSFTVRFERSADLQTIRRGYGAGLKLYRKWLYQNISTKKIAAKQRDYFSPEEIDLIMESVKHKPALFDYWLKNVPRNAAEIRFAANSTKPAGK